MSKRTSISVLRCCHTTLLQVRRLGSLHRLNRSFTAGRMNSPGYMPGNSRTFPVASLDRLLFGAESALALKRASRHWAKMSPRLTPRFQNPSRRRSPGWPPRRCLEESMAAWTGMACRNARCHSHKKWGGHTGGSRAASRWFRRTERCSEGSKPWENVLSSTDSVRKDRRRCLIADWSSSLESRVGRDYGAEAICLTFVAYLSTYASNWRRPYVNVSIPTFWPLPLA